MQKLLPLSLLTFGLTAGCASSGAAPAPERVVMIDETTGTSIRSVNDRSGPTTALTEPADKVYEAVTVVFALLKVPRTVASTSTGEQGNTKFAMSRSFNGRPVSTYLSCGDDPLAGSERRLVSSDGGPGNPGSAKWLGIIPGDEAYRDTLQAQRQHRRHLLREHRGPRAENRSDGGRPAKAVTCPAGFPPPHAAFIFKG